MKPDRAASTPGDAPDGGGVAGIPQSGPGRAGAARAGLRQFAALVGVAALCLGAASLAALLAVRVGFDLAAGIDPFTPPGRRPDLGPAELDRRAFALDALRQLFLAALVLAWARRRDPTAWRQRLALDRAGPNGMRPAALLAVLLAWPALHIAWVTGTAAAFGARFGERVGLSPAMGRADVAAWLLYLTVLAPAAEELLMRGELFARARAAFGPAGATLATAAIFSAAHLSAWGLARPVSVLPLALALGWLRWRTGRLWPCIALHGWSNLALVAYLLRPS